MPAGTKVQLISAVNGRALQIMSAANGVPFVDVNGNPNDEAAWNSEDSNLSYYSSTLRRVPRDGQDCHVAKLQQLPVHHGCVGQYRRVQR